MKKRFSLLVFDLDDTALDEQKQLRPEVEQKLCEAAKHGCRLVPATGRVLSGIPKAILQLPSVRYVITANGATVHDLQENTLLHSDCFSNDIAISLVRELQKEPGFVSVFIGNESYTPTRSVDFLKDSVSPAVLEYFQQSRLYTEDIESLITSSSSRVEKFNINYANEKTRNAMRTYLCQRDDLFISSSMGLNLEINTRSATKGNALSFLAQHLSIPLNDVMAVGDSDNDISMLAVAGLGIAMGTASEGVRMAADAFCPSAFESGLAHAIAEHFLF